MRVIRGLRGPRAPAAECVATIGNFDGLHRGHQAVLTQLGAMARRLRTLATAVIFEPQPREYFQGGTAPARLCRLREKLSLLGEHGVDQTLALRFDAALAGLSAEDFAGDLARRLKLRGVVIGDDFRFGKNRAGDYPLLRAVGERNGFAVEAAATFMLDGVRVSSSRVRDALTAGDMEQARRWLGRYYSMEGRVMHGEKRGRTLGFPTVNVDLHRHAAPVSGIFAARVHGLKARALKAMAYVGTRPAVGGAHTVMEAHVFGYDEDCYGRHLRIEFVRKLREDMALPSLQALQAQMERDAEEARRVLAATGTG
ncbi:MAG TPA: bifunctional riboflavin kinase/FAD synthetase [Gammaproteobacteria bacterium]|nr:bifunctional riboflavin kinase/FAD synthetase [Gammaproteobacteria bacterium]